MKNVWKWILGILIAVAVIVAAVLGVRYLVSNGYLSMPAGLALHDKANRGFADQPGPQMFNDPHGFRPRGFDGFGGPMRRGRGFGPLMFIGGLLRLVVFGALLYGAYWLGRRNARVVLDPGTVAPAREPVEVPKTRTRKAAKS